MSDDVSYKLVGIGAVKVRMHDGVVRTLSNMMHSIEMTKNLISLRSMDYNGYRLVIEDGIPRIIKGALVVIKRKQFETLYELVGSTIVGITVVTLSTLSYSDVTRISHMRLGHMSIRGLTELSKQGLLDGQSTCTIKFYEYCVFGKQKWVSFLLVKHGTRELLEYIIQIHGSNEGGFQRWFAVLHHIY